MKRFLWLIIFIPVLSLLPGCNKAPDTQSITALTFDRGNGSVWGNQLYISMTEQEISTLRYIPAGTGQLETLEHIPITASQWETIVQAVRQLTLEEEKHNFLEKLFPRQDGADYRHLTLIYGEQSVTYRWPADGENLEALLEQLVQDVTH